MLSGVIFQPFIGWLLDHSSGGKMLNGIRVYDPMDFAFALSSISISLLLACFVVFLIKEQYTK
jgi:hypothetical protein